MHIAPYIFKFFHGASESLWVSLWWNLIVFLSLFASYVLATIVIIYLLNIIDSLSNYISINTYISPISRVLRGEIYRYKR